MWDPLYSANLGTVLPLIIKTNPQAPLKYGSPYHTMSSVRFYTRCLYHVCDCRVELSTAFSAVFLTTVL